MIIYKDNIIIKKSIFEILSKTDPDAVAKMLRNKMVLKSERERDREKIDEDEINGWLRENCSGLIYFVDEGNTYRDFFIYYFEKEEDAVAFKIKWS